MTKILLSTADVSADNYITAVRKAGGEAAGGYLPIYEENYDGLILCGGGDVHPRYFGENINGANNIDERRDEAEFALIEAFLRAGKPILGICRGIQVLNVYFGGTLYQDLDNASVHSSFAEHDLLHPVLSVKGSMIHSLYENEFTVNSFHHQAVGMLGKGLIATAFCGEVIEAVEHESLSVFGVQWHPERVGEDGIKIFRNFVDICRRL